jgi:DNA polymerase III sliding clamp (beta) subunit (PCNA family)
MFNPCPFCGVGEMMNTQEKQETAGDSQNIVIKIDPKYKLEKVVSKDETRTNITVIKLDATTRFGQCAVATNGRSMAIVPVEFDQGSAPNDKGLINVEALQASRKVKHAAGNMTLNGAIELPDGRKFPRPSAADHSYPNWEAVLPKEKATLSVGVNAKLLLELAQAIGSETVRLDFIDALSPITVTPCGYNAQGGHGVIMPMRIS